MPRNLMSGNYIFRNVRLLHVPNATFKRLEPWLVSKVQVDGDLDLMSILVNGEQVSEDIDLSGDIQRLKAPPLRKRRLFVLVGIFSSGNNFDRWMAIRRSWMYYEQSIQGMLPFVSSQTKFILAKYVMKTDDDAFVSIDEVLASLRRSVSHGLLCDLISFESSPEREKG